MNSLRKNKKLETVVDVSYRNDSKYFDDNRLERQFYRPSNNKNKEQLTLERNKEKYGE